METDNFNIEGTKGNWIAADETIVDGRQFFLLVNDIYKDDVPYVVVSEDGQVVTDESLGFDETTLIIFMKIRTIFLHLLPDIQAEEHRLGLHGKNLDWSHIRLMRN